MSGIRGRGWSRRKSHAKGGDATESAHLATPEAMPEGHFAVDIYLDSGGGVVSWPTQLDDADKSEIVAPHSSRRIQPYAPTAADDVQEALTTKQPEGSPAPAAIPVTTPPVAEVLGTVQVPQIIVGAGSPEVEPALIGEQFRSFPFRPDTVVDGWSTDLVTIRAASLRGHLHRYNGAPRQDDFAVHRMNDGRVIVLVADGVSESPQAHLGATAAVRAASRWLVANAPVVTGDTDWLALMKDAAWALAEQARVTFELGNPDPQIALTQLSTTLLCAVIESSSDEALSAHVVAVGDSGAWLLSGGEFSALTGGKTVTDQGISSSAVTGLPQVPAELPATVIEVRAGEVLLLGTDGFGDPLGNGTGGVGNLFRELLGGSGPPSLTDFARALDFSRETFDDDRTLVAITPRAPGNRS